MQSALVVGRCHTGYSNANGDTVHEDSLLDSNNSLLSQTRDTTVFAGNGDLAHFIFGRFVMQNNER